MLLFTKKAGSPRLELTSKEARPVQKGVEGTGREHASLWKQQQLVGTVLVSAWRKPSAPHSLPSSVPPAAQGRRVVCPLIRLCKEPSSGPTGKAS